MTVPRNIFDFFIEPIRSMDKKEGRDFLRRWLIGPQNTWVMTDEKIDSVKDLWSITECPDEYLRYLKWIVGWTPELDRITEQLDFDELRRLISVSGKLWKQRGIESAIVDVMFFATAERSHIWNWFDFRWVLGETAFGEERDGSDSWLIPLPGDEVVDLTPRLSSLRIVDDGDLNRVLVIDLLKLMRANGERWEINYLSLLDLFDVPGDDTQWDKTGATDIEVTDGLLTFGTNSTDQLVENIHDLSLLQGCYSVRTQVKTSGDVLGIYLKDDNDNVLYEFDVYPTEHNYAGSVSLFVYNIADDLITEFPFDLPDEVPVQRDVFYTFRVTMADEVDGRIRLKFFIDGNEIFEHVDDQFVPGTGGVGDWEFVDWDEERPGGDVDDYWTGASIGGDATPKVLVWTDYGNVFIGTYSGGVFVWAADSFMTDPDSYWQSGTVGYDGLTMILGAYGSQPWLTENGGSTWEEQTWVDTGYDWYYALGGDDQTIFRVAYGASPYVSSDLGDNWTETTIAGLLTNNWQGCAIGRDPLVMAAISDTRAYLTTDGWATYSELQPYGDQDIDWAGVSIGGDNQSVVLRTWGGPVLFSPDRGVTWYIADAIGDSDWWGLALGADGKLAFATEYGSRLWKTDDVSIGPPRTGVPWGHNGWGGLAPYGNVSDLRLHLGISISYDGTVIITQAYNQYPRISIDGGHTWRDETSGGTSLDTRIVVGGDNQKLFRTQNGAACAISYDQGSSWSYVLPGGYGSGSWLACAIGRDPDVMAACRAWVGAWATTDDWSTSIPLAYPGVSNPGGIAIGGDDQTIVVIDISAGTIYLTSNLGSTWQLISSPPEIDFWPLGVAISQNCSTIYISSSKSFWYTSDLGVTWTKFQPAGPYEMKFQGVGVGGDSGPQALVCGGNGGAFIYPALGSADGVYLWAEVTAPFVGGGGG